MTTTNFPSLTTGPGTTLPVHAPHGGESECSGRDHFPGVKQGLDVCRRGGMAKCSRLVSFIYIYFLKKIFSCLLLSRPICRPPAWRHYRKDCMPVHDPLATLCLRLQIQWLRSDFRQDQELEFLHPWRSKEKRRKYVNLSIRADRFPSTIRESVYPKRGIERSRRDQV